ncbi:Putative triacylglycerol lipase precursor [Mycobacteroides abscessus subsp. abscessus]|nr:Putative triacylglycerol lipase precursor [Mycobacteroides abscessus subsp. abscessus]
MGPAGVQQAVGSDFLNRLNKTPDTRPGVNYLVLGSKNDTTATPYESTFLKAGPGSAVFNVEEHSLPGAKPTRQTPTPTLILRSTVRSASPQPKTAETPPSAPARTTSSIKVLAAAAPKIPAPQSAAAADAGTNSAASSNRATAQTQTAKTSDTSPNTQARQRTNIGAISSGDHSPTAPESKESAATIASTATSGTSATKSDKTSQVNAKGSPAIAEPKTSVAKADMHHTDAAASKPDNTAPRTKGASTSAEHSSSGESSRAGQSSAGSAHERTARRSKTARSSE